MSRPVQKIPFQAYQYKKAALKLGVSETLHISPPATGRGCGHFECMPNPDGGGCAAFPPRQGRARVKLGKIPPSLLSFPIDHKERRFGGEAKAAARMLHSMYVAKEKISRRKCFFFSLSHVCTLSKHTSNRIVTF